jgi:glycosyltransferase involved in cell wall biosynthesis
MSVVVIEGTNEGEERLMAHVLFLTPYYPPEVGAPQTRISETATRLARRGHEVTVLTTLPNYPTGVVPVEYRAGKRRRETIDGVRVLRVWSYISPNRGFLRRILAQLSFGALAGPLGAGAVRRSGKPDVIIVESPPLFDSYSGRHLARRFRAPYIFTVADIWPESAVQLGMLRNRLLIRMAERLEWTSYWRAGAVWSVTAGIRQTLIDRGLPEDKVFLLPNGVDTQKFRPLPQSEARQALGWDDRFTVLYAGTIGLAHGLDTLLGAADALKERPDVRFVLAGAGAAKEELMAEAARRQLENVTFLDPLPHDLMPTLISAADASLVSLRNLPLFQSALPSKMYEAMACARPIILAVDGEARDLVEREAGAALHVEPENSQALADAIVQLKGDPELAAQLGARGRAFVLRRFDRDQLVVALEERILQLTTRRSSATHTDTAMHQPEPSFDNAR